MVRELLNTLYVMTPNAYLRLENETVRVEVEGEAVGRAPLHHLGALVLLGPASLSPRLMERCAEEGRDVTLLDYGGRFRCRVEGPVSGNVLLRKAQYEAAVSAERCAGLARSFVAAKIRSSRRNVMRAVREARRPEATARLREACDALEGLLTALAAVRDLDVVRGVEGQAAAVYLGVFGELITAPSEAFAYRQRTRRPPRDRVNALLSFLYSILCYDCASACEGVGLDPQFGFLHALRPGRPSLALDLMEEFRAPLVDRLVLALINRRQMKPEHFEEGPGGSVLLNAEGRKLVLTAYQKRKQEEVPHTLLKAKVPLGLVPHLQARLLARHLRGDLTYYQPYVGS